MQLWRRFTAWIGALPASRVTWGLALAFSLWAVLDVFVFKVSGGLANSTYDAMVRARFHATAPDPRMVIVDIDEASLAQMGKEFGRWPWPRDTLATVLDYIEKQNPQAIAWDVVFSDADRLSPGGDKAFDEAARRSTRSHFAVVRLPSEYDAQSKATRTVLPGLWLAGSQPSSSTVALIPPVLPAVAAAKLGYNNGYADADGVLRRYRMAETLPDGGQLQSMALSVATTLNKNAPDFIAAPAIKQGLGGIFSTKNSDSLIVWRAQANSYPRVPFASVFAVAEGGTSARPVPSFAGKIVLIGATASSLHDIHPTPLGAKHAGVDSLATAIDNAVNQRHLAELPRALLAALAMALCMGMAWWVQRWGISSLDAALLLLPGALLGVSYVSLNGSPVFIDLHVAAGVALLFIASLRIWNGWRRNYWCAAIDPAHSAGPHALMALQLAQPAADAGLDAVIRTLEHHAPHCRVMGGDATARWPLQLRWPELHHAVAIAGPLADLQALRALLLAPGPVADALPCLACTEPEAMASDASRSEWAERARAACNPVQLHHKNTA